MSFIVDTGWKIGDFFRDDDDGVSLHGVRVCVREETAAFTNAFWWT